MTLDHSVLIRCDASYSQGFGHLVRCLALADELKGHHECTVTFAMREDAQGVMMASAHGYHVVTAAESNVSEEYNSWIQRVCQDYQIEVVVLDIRDTLPCETVRELRQAGILMVAIDDPSERRLEVDLVFYPPVPQVQKMDWSSFSGERYVGWEWVILRPEFAQSIEKIKNQKPVILVTMGGSDPAGITFTVLDALAGVKEPCDVLVIVGPGFRNMERLELRKTQLPHFLEIHSHVGAMHELMARADMAIVSFGVTAYELAAMGVPAVYLCLTQDHARSASFFHSQGLGCNLGAIEELNPEHITRIVSDILNAPEQLEAMREQARHLPIGQGAQRVATTIMQKEKERHEPGSRVARA